MGCAFQVGWRVWGTKALSLFCPISARNSKLRNIVSKFSLRTARVVSAFLQRASASLRSFKALWRMLQTAMKSLNFKYISIHPAADFISRLCRSFVESKAAQCPASRREFGVSFNGPWFDSPKQLPCCFGRFISFSSAAKEFAVPSP